MKLFGTLGRGLKLLAHLLAGTLIAALVLLLQQTGWLDRDRLAHWWLARLLAILQVQLAVKGRAVSGGRLIVCNHVSWLDIALLGTARCSRFVAKSDIQRWPVVGLYAQAMGTFFIRRERGGSGPLLERLRPHLKAGGSVVLFPEGTTTDGTGIAAFHPRLFQAAIESGCVVQPAAIRYGLAGNGRSVAPFMGRESLVTHVLRMLINPGIEAELHFCPPIAVNAQSQRQALARKAESSIRAALATPTPSSVAANGVAFERSHSAELSAR